MVVFFLSEFRVPLHHVTHPSKQYNRYALFKQLTEGSGTYPGICTNFFIFNFHLPSTIIHGTKCYTIPPPPNPLNLGLSFPCMYLFRFFSLYPVAAHTCIPCHFAIKLVLCIILYSHSSDWLYMNIQCTLNYLHVCILYGKQYY